MREYAGNYSVANTEKFASPASSVTTAIPHDDHSSAQRKVRVKQNSTYPRSLTCYTPSFGAYAPYGTCDPNERPISYRP